MSECLRIANCSGFYGDRLSAALKGERPDGCQRHQLTHQAAGRITNHHLAVVREW